MDSPQIAGSVTERRRILAPSLAVDDCLKQGNEACSSYAKKIGPCSPARAEPLRALVLPFACKFVQNKLLGQTTDDVQAHPNPKVPEYMSSIAIRTRVVRKGNGR